MAGEFLSSGAMGWYLTTTDHDRESCGCGKEALVCPGTSVSAPAAIVTRPPDRSWSYLIHWTRRQSGAWPDQEEEAYLDELLFDFARTDRSPLAALIRIVRMQRIVATRRLIRGAFRVVCFTQRHLSELARRHVFRSHQQRWDFEPYGICIDRDWLIDRKARPVIYGDDLTWHRLSPDERPFFQRRKTRPTPTGQQISWSDEWEWRHMGDVDLRSLPASRGLVFVPSDQAAGVIARISRWPVTVISAEQQET
jgi:hypothetical protein